MLKSFWVLVVMDLFTRRIVGFGVEPAEIDGVGGLPDVQSRRLRPATPAAPEH